MVATNVILFLKWDRDLNVDILALNFSFSTNEKRIALGANFPLLTHLSTPLLSFRRPIKNYNEQIVDSFIEKVNKKSCLVLDFGAGIGTLAEIFIKKLR